MSLYVYVEGQVRISTQSDAAANKAAEELRLLLSEWREKHQHGSAVYALSVKTVDS